MSKNIPVDEAIRLGQTYDQTHIVIVALDERTNEWLTVTFGLRDERDKLNAVGLAEHFMRSIGDDTTAILNENRVLPGPIQLAAERRGFEAACDAIADALSVIDFSKHGLELEEAMLALRVARDAVYRVRDAEAGGPR